MRNIVKRILEEWDDHRDFIPCLGDFPEGKEILWSDLSTIHLDEIKSVANVIEDALMLDVINDETYS